MFQYIAFWIRVGSKLKYVFDETLNKFSGLWINTKMKIHDKMIFTMRIFLNSICKKVSILGFTNSHSVSYDGLFDEDT